MTNPQGCFAQGSGTAVTIDHSILYAWWFEESLLAGEVAGGGQVANAENAVSAGSNPVYCI